MKSLIAFSLTAVCFASSYVWANEEKQPLTTVVINDENESLLADSRGNTLYVFDLDQNKTGSVCNAACAEVWPPYLLSSEEVAKLAAPLGKIDRDNKKPQLTYNGRPVYTYAFDRGSAADAGDGVGNVWHYIEIK